MKSFTLPMRAVLDPLGAVPPAIDERRWAVALIAASLLTAASGAAIASRLDHSRVVIPRMEMTGQLAKSSEREVSEAVEQAGRIGLVTAVAKGVFLTPLLVLLLGVALKVAAWLIGRKAAFSACFTAAALAMVPVAVFHLVQLASALNQTELTVAMAQKLVPTSVAALMDAGPRLGRVYAALDVINLWAALTMGLGFAAATQWSPWKGAVFGVWLYVLFACVFIIGLPGLMPGPGMGGPGGRPQ